MAIAPEVDQAFVPHPRQMLRYGRLADPAEFDQGADSRLAAIGQSAKNEQPPLISERFQEDDCFGGTGLKVRNSHA